MERANILINSVQTLKPLINNKNVDILKQKLAESIECLTQSCS